jgi:hypothetical protein
MTGLGSFWRLSWIATRIPRARAASRSRTACRPDWVGAGGTVFAFFVALRLLDKELEVRREQQEDRRSVQARLVSQWIPEPERQAPTPNFVFAVIVHNGSEEPIYNVTITMAPPDSAHAADPEAGPTEAGTLRYQRPVMAPGETFRDEHPMVPDLPGHLGVSFTDAAGRRWKRYPDGRLVEPGRPRRRSRKDYYNAWIAGELENLDY